MRGALRVLRKEWLELLLNWRVALLTLAFPPIFVLLIGQLRTPVPTLRILVAGAPETARRSLSLVEDLSTFRISTRDDAAIDPLQEIRAHSYDLVANFGEVGKSDWAFYTAETDPLRLRAVRLFTVRLEQVLKVISEPSSPAGANMSRLTSLLAAPTPSALFTYFPQADMRQSLLPEMTALILCFLPFALASSSWIREKDAHTLEVLLVAPGLSPVALFVGKCLFPVTAAGLVFYINLFLVQDVYNLYVKGDLMLITAFVIPALLASSFLGLTVSALVSTQSQTVLTSTAAFFGMTLLSGFLYPITAESSTVVVWLSRLFPLTFVHPVVKPWMYGAGFASAWWPSLQVLLAQCGLAGSFAWLSFQRTRRRL